MSLSLGEWSALGTRLLVISKRISEKGKREDHPIIHNPQRLATSLPSLQRNCATESSWRNVKWLTCTTAGLMAVPASLTQQHWPRHLALSPSCWVKLSLLHIMHPHFSTGEMVLTGESDHVSPLPNPLRWFPIAHGVEPKPLAWLTRPKYSGICPPCSHTSLLAPRPCTPDFLRILFSRILLFALFKAQLRYHLPEKPSLAPWSLLVFLDLARLQPFWIDPGLDDKIPEKKDRVLLTKAQTLRQPDWFQFLALPFTSCSALSKLLNLFVPQLRHL